MKSLFLVGYLACLMVTTVMADDTLQPLFDFAEADAAKEWQTVNDGVMGGVSEGKFKITDAKTMEFFGNLSLANNGAFASVRTKPKNLGLEKGDALVAKVRGDGREYMLNLCPITCEDEHLLCGEGNFLECLGLFPSLPAHDHGIQRHHELGVPISSWYFPTALRGSADGLNLRE